MTLHEVITNAVDSHPGSIVDHRALIEDLTDAVETWVAGGTWVTKDGEAPEPGSLADKVLGMAPSEQADDGSLLPDQARRIAALRAARDVLETRRTPNVLAGSSATPPDTYDLISVARFVLEGTETWEREAAAGIYAPPDEPEVQENGLPS